MEQSQVAEEELRKEVAGAKRVLDLWTAEPLGLDGARDEALQLGEDLIAGEETKLSKQAEELADEQRALHWPLAFAEVFARKNPGFDVIVGNPPWEEVTIEELAFYALHRPGIRALPEKERRSAIKDLTRERPELPERLAGEQERLAKLRGYLGPDAGYVGGAGDPDVYKYFCQRYRELLRDYGRLGVVLPRSVFLAKGSSGFRHWLFEEAAPERVDFLVNNRLWMFDTHPQWTVALLAAKREVPRVDALVEVAGIAASRHEFVAQSEAPGLRIAKASLGPELEIPLLANQAAVDLLAKLRSDRPFPYGGGQWNCFPVAEFHETNDAKLWRGATKGWPLWTGKSFDQYDPHGHEARSCPAENEALERAKKPRPGSKWILADRVSLADRRSAVKRTVGSARIILRDVSRATDSRTVLACLAPPRIFLTNSGALPFLRRSQSHAEAACLALMNSLPFDWQARRFVERHLNFFVLEGLKLPSLTDDDVKALATPAARLSCPDERFAEFAEATGVECGPLDDGERNALRAEIDARVARIWGLTDDELEIVFSDFTLDAVPDAYRDAVRKRFAELS